jgi:hypothetical protein
MEYSQQNGFVNGLCNIVKLGLDKLVPTQYPIYCSDIKRDVIYMKINGLWVKDINNNKLIELMEEISNIQYKYVKNIWFEKNQQLIMSSNDYKLRHCKYLVAVSNSATSDKFRNHIINKIVRLVNIDKNIY